MGEIIDRRTADPAHEVITIKEKDLGYRRQPCAGCPWRRENTGDFPAEVFGHSATTAYDQSVRTFGCHESGPERSKICAGFLLRGADDNLAVRMHYAMGKIDPDSLDEGDAELFDTYREMAVANGLPEDDPRLEECRP